MEDKGPWRALDDWDPDRLPLDVPRASIGRRLPIGDEAGLRAALRLALGADEAVLKDPLGEAVVVGLAIADHILDRLETRWDGREAYFNFIPELIGDPAEIWVGFAVNELSGRVAIRRRYVKYMELPDKTVLGACAEVQDGFWVAWDFCGGK